MLTEAAINGKVDYLRGLKENVIMGRFPQREDCLGRTLWKKSRWRMRRFRPILACMIMKRGRFMRVSGVGIVRSVW